MANAPTPPIPERSPFWSWAFRFERLRALFQELHDDIEGVWLIGPHLAAPFFWISRVFLALADLSYRADNLIVWLVQWVRGIVEGDTFKNLLFTLSHHYFRIKYDPVGWVRDVIDYLSGEYRTIRTDPVGWIKNRLLLAYPALRAILFNSTGWVTQILFNRYPELQGFLNNIKNYIIGTMLGAFWWLRDLQNGPLNAVVKWITGRANWFNAFLLHPFATVFWWYADHNPWWLKFWSDPRDWVREHVAAMLNIPWGKRQNLLDALIEKIFETLAYNVFGVLARIESYLVDIILYFM